MEGRVLKWTAWSLGLGLALLGLADAPARAGGEDRAALRVEPAEILLYGAASEHGLLVTDPSGRDVTREATYTLSNPRVALSLGEGRFRASVDGDSELTVRHGGGSVVLKLRVIGVDPSSPPSFRHEVVPILTRYGCSQGACHGKQDGQNGFKLSLRGWLPEADYEAIVVQSQGRRIFPASPDHSLILAKPAGKIPHRGGALLATDGRPYRTLVRWIDSGAARPPADEPTVASLEVLGGGRLLRPGQEQPLLVLAHFTDGAVRDVTWISQFFVNDPSVLQVTPEGRVRARREGVSTVRAHFQDKVTIAAFTIPREGSVDPAQYVSANNEIDAHVFAVLRSMKIPPSAPSTDAEFLRRASLDATGTLPTADDARAFLADPAPDKRSRLVADLLRRPEFDDYWALLLGDLLQNRKERDHDVRGSKGVRAFHEWLRGQVAANRPWNDLARDILTASGDTTTRPEIGYFVVTVGEMRQPEYSEISISAAQSFLGTRILCAKCHNHPEERYTQDDYYHFAAFFSRVSLDRQAPAKGPTGLAIEHPEERQWRKQAEDLEKQIAKLEASLPGKPEEEGKKIQKDLDQKKKQRDDARKRADEVARRPVQIQQPRSGKMLAPQPLDRSAVTLAPGEDPRKALVDWMTSPTNEYFSGSIMNRLWKHFMGTGLVEPVDDLRPSNPPSNPALWKFLREEFVRSGFDLRHMMGLLMNSRAYQLGSDTRPENENDRRFYSHYLARRLPAEVLLDAVSRVTGVPDAFPGYPVGVRAIQLPDPAMDSYFLSLFGRSNRVTACACEREGEVTLPQLLHMQNGDGVVQKIRSGDGRLEALLRESGGDPAKIEETLFLATLGRLPRDSEKQALRRALEAEKGDRTDLWRDLLWALVNSKEFVFNH
jgi:hypothetical protein